MSRDRLRTLLDDGAAHTVLGFFAGMPEPERRNLFTALPGYAAEQFPRRGSARPGHALRAEARAGRLTIAVVACAPTAKAGAAVLTRAAVRQRLPFDPAPVLAAAAERGVPWLGDLGRAVAAGLPSDGDGEFAFTVAVHLIEAGGGPWPDGPEFVRSWVWSRLRRMGPGVDEATHPDAVAADPALDTVAPRLFDVDDLHLDWPLQTRAGAAVDGTRTVDVLATLTGRGRLDRAMVLDGCVDRMCAARRPHDAVAFQRLYDLLRPAPGEVARWRVPLAGILAGAAGPQAKHAQRELCRAADAGAVELDAVLDASPGVLMRTEKGLVRDQLGWLAGLADRHPERIDDVLGAVATALENPDAELRDRAATVIRRYRPQETVTAPAPDPVTDVLPVPAAAPFPPPITGPDELAEELTALAKELDAVRLDRVLDGLARLSAGDPAGLAAAVRPVQRRYFDSAARPYGLVRHPRGVLAAVVYTVAGHDRYATELAELTSPGAAGRRSSPMDRLWMARTAAVVAAPQPFLIAVPTHRNGLLEPGVLVDRLTRAERDGWEPAAADLTQALLRLPRHAPAELAATAGPAARLTGAAGRRLAAWVAAGGQPDPRVVRVAPDRVDLEPAGRDEAGLCAVQQDFVHVGYVDMGRLWPSVAPAHREAVAAHALPALADHATSDERVPGIDVLPALAAATGPIGLASHLALAYGMTARHAADRIAAVDGLLLMTGSGDLDAAALGAEIGALALAGSVRTNRIVDALTGVVRGGAPQLGGRILRALLPPLLTAAAPPAATAAVLALAAEAATAAGPAEAATAAGPAEAATAAGPASGRAVPGLAEVAARKGSSRLVAEARRLQRALGAGG